MTYLNIILYQLLKLLPQSIVKIFSRRYIAGFNFNETIMICKKLNTGKQEHLHELNSVDGIGSAQIDSLKKFFLNHQNFKVLTDLIALLLIQDYKILSKNTPLSRKLIMFTGGFKDKSRSELKMLAENLGAKIVNSITKKNNFLIVGSHKPTKRKIDEAKKLNVKILSEKSWHKFIS